MVAQQQANDTAQQLPHLRQHEPLPNTGPTDKSLLVNPAVAQLDSLAATFTHGQSSLRCPRKYTPYIHTEQHVAAGYPSTTRDGQACNAFTRKRITLSGHGRNSSILREKKTPSRTSAEQLDPGIIDLLFSSDFCWFSFFLRISPRRQTCLK